MRNSKVLSKLRSDRFARMCAMGHLMPFFVRYAAHFNYDGIWLDLEHRTMTDREVQTLLALCRAADIDCMVRPPTVERTRLYRYLEDGATGFMIPFVSDAEMARDLVRAVKFPPEGNRGLDGAGQDADFGLTHFVPDSTFTADANRQTFITAQIETLEAVRNIEQIAEVPGIDVLFIGPGDLGLRLSTAPESERITLDAAIDAVAAAARAHNEAWGITAASPEQIARYRQMGAQMVPWGSDFFLVNVLEKCCEELDGVLGE